VAVPRECQIAPLYGPLSPRDLEDCRKRLGFEPLQVRVARQCVVLVVHATNPIRCLTLEQIDAMFSAARKRGAPEAITTWGQLGLGGAWASRKVVLYGRNAASGTYYFFKEVALACGDFAPSVHELPGSSSVVKAVAADPGGLGYVDLGYVAAGVKVVPILLAPSEPYRPRAHTVRDDYPLARPLYLAVNQPPGRPLDPLVAEFLRLVLSRPGQKAVTEGGQLPLRADECAEQQRLLEKTLGR
jgi:phosphate transport system substrate-binding protein